MQLDRTRESRRIYSHVEEEFVIGLEDDILELSNKLVINDHHHKMVVISGMGGLGKTTLVRKLYHHNSVRKHFLRCAWARISQQFQTRSVILGILLDLIPDDKQRREEVQRLQDGHLHEELSRMLKKKSYLVVLDDLLDIETSWKLLQKTAFPDEIVMSVDLEQLGKKMLEHCKGLPLAVVVLGGVLANKRTADDWKNVLDNIRSYFGADDNSVYDVLGMSYYDLPDHLKPCFLHLGIFPEDFEMPVDRLYRMWMVERIVPVDRKTLGGKSSEEVAEGYLNELVERRMVQAAKVTSQGKVRACRLHDLIRDVSMAIGREENFVSVIDHIHGQSDEEPAPTPDNERLHRLSLYVGQDVKSSLSYSLSRNAPNLRSLLFFQYEIKNDEMLRLDGLSLLETLKGVDIDRVELKGLLGLRKLRKLCVSYFSNRVEKLDIVDEITVQLQPEMLPKSLLNLGFVSTKLSQDSMPILEHRLPLLEKMRLIGPDCVNLRHMVCSAAGFPELTDLVIRDLPSLVEWRMEQGAMPKLRSLEIFRTGMKKLPDALPEGINIACRPCVRGIERFGTCPHFKDALSAGKEN
ncbi:hypothetical protein Dimus_008760 [Dionaea muscipula]